MWSLEWGSLEENEGCSNHLVIFSIGVLSNELGFGQLLFECSNTFIILVCSLFETFATTWSWKRRKRKERHVNPWREVIHKGKKRRTRSKLTPRNDWWATSGAGVSRWASEWERLVVYLFVFPLIQISQLFRLFEKLFESVIAVSEPRDFPIQNLAFSKTGVCWSLSNGSDKPTQDSTREGNRSTADHLPFTFIGGVRSFVEFRCCLLKTFVGTFEIFLD